MFPKAGWIIPAESDHFFARHVAIQREFEVAKDRMAVLPEEVLYQTCLKLYANWVKLTIDSPDYKSDYKGLSSLAFTNIVFLFYKHTLMVGHHEPHLLITPNRFTRWKYKTFGHKKKVVKNLLQFSLLELWKYEDALCPQCVAEAFSKMNLFFDAKSIGEFLPK